MEYWNLGVPLTDSGNRRCNASLTKADKAEGRIIRDNISGRSTDNEVNALAYSMEGRKAESSLKERTNGGDS